MTIRTETERAAAVAKMQEMISAGRQGRPMTDSEHHLFESLASDVAEFDAAPTAAKVEPAPPPSPAPAPSPPTTPPAMQAQGKIDTAHAVEICRICEAADAMHLASGLLVEGVTVAEARERAGAVSTIREMVATAHRLSPAAVSIDLAAAYLAERRSVQAARADLFARMVAAEEAVGEISSHPPPPSMVASGIADTRASMVKVLRARGIEPRSP
ncbi:hypothetical protein DK419_26690 [Methylobacterium terrae]|uniref:Uncharacterized protein n=1 Tax=Methylobacterium terrae TaxID=2202827 RepID=A0A2U8WTT9_9HYPH|nr:hypothetical protein [Methylobacterium terrae]AWN49483.1 hypothetical protein DK419_26690 [Methylobacterium terrae]